MSKFADTVKQDTPRLAVLFRRSAPDQEQFQWGIVGRMPILGLIGYLTKIQQELDDPWTDQLADEVAFVVVWHERDNQFEYFTHYDIPKDSLIGMLEVVKMALVDSQLVQQVRNQQIELLGPDGKPMRR